MFNFFRPKKGSRHDILRVERDIQPAHFTLKIETYSLLLEALDGKCKRHETGNFDAGGYKWKLILYPQGNKTGEGKKYISLYLAIDESNSFSKDKWIVYANFKFFVLNQKTMKYLTIQDAKGAVKHFDELRNEYGFAELLSLDEFNDPSNGYLVNDHCVFGVEVLVNQPSAGRKESIAVVNEIDKKMLYTWSIKDFSNLNEDCQYSDAFTVGGRKWKLKLHPKGNIYARGKSLSLFIWLQDPEERKVHAKYKLRVLDHYQFKNVEKPGSTWFGIGISEWGFHEFIPLKELINGYLKNDTLTVQVEFDMISAIKIRS